METRNLKDTLSKTSYTSSPKATNKRSYNKNPGSKTHQDKIQSKAPYKEKEGTNTTNTKEKNYKGKSNYGRENNPLTSKIKSDIIAFKMVSKTTKGGRRPSISVTLLFTKPEEKGKFLVVRRKDKNMLNIRSYIQTIKETDLKTVSLPENRSISTDMSFNYKGMTVIAKRQKKGKGIKCCDVVRPLVVASNIDSVCIKFKGKKNTTSMIQATELILQKSLEYQNKMLSRKIVI